MNKKYIENFRLIGFEVKECKTMKEFMQDIKDRCNWYCYGDVSFRKYMNDEISGVGNCISDGWYDEDACIFIEYKDGTKYSFYPSLGAEGKFKENGIKWAILSDGYGYTVYNYDLSVEWEEIELDEIESEAIEKRIPVETLKLQKKLLSEQEQEQVQTIPQKKGKEEPEEVAEVLGTEEPKQAQSEQEQTQEFPQKKGKEEPEEVAEVPGTEEPKQAQSEQEQKIKVEDLYLSIRAYNALKRANINSVQDFFDLSPEEIKMKIGEKNATETMFVLHQMGIDKPEKDVSEQEQSEQEQEQVQTIPQKKGKEEPEEVAEVLGTEEPKQAQSEQAQSEQEQTQEFPQKKGKEERKIVYKIDILKALKEAGYNQGRIKREKLLNGSAVDKIRSGNTDISLKTVSVICNLLNAEPGDILTMVTIPQKEGKEEPEEVAEVPGTEEPKQKQSEQGDILTMVTIPQKEGKEEPEEVAEVPDTEEPKQKQSEQGDILTMVTIPQKKGKEEPEEVAEAPGTEEPKQKQSEQGTPNMKKEVFAELPELSAVSDKQKKYAVDIRTAYLEKVKQAIEEVQPTIATCKREISKREVMMGFWSSKFWGLFVEFSKEFGAHSSDKNIFSMYTYYSTEEKIHSLYDMNKKYESIEEYNSYCKKITEKAVSFTLDVFEKCVSVSTKAKIWIDKLKHVLYR